MSTAPIKPPRTYQDQLMIMRDRGLIITNEQRAIDVLQEVNYYRFAAYTLSLKTGDVFHPGVTFDRIYDLYLFDQQLRHMVLALLEDVEIALRTRIAYYLGHTYGSLGYLDPANFNDAIHHQDFMGQFREAQKRRGELFIQHHRKKYSGLFPVWAAVELLSFGTLSKLYANLHVKDQVAIADTHYRVPNVYLRSWLLCLTVVRNICAHYGRLYNRNFMYTPKLHRKDKEHVSGDLLFPMVFCMKRITEREPNEKWSPFITNLSALVERYDNSIVLGDIGFPVNWEDILRNN